MRLDIVKVGDLVKRKSKVGREHKINLFAGHDREPLGIITKMASLYKDSEHLPLAVVSFMGGREHTFPEYLLELIGES